MREAEGLKSFCIPNWDTEHLLDLKFGKGLSGAWQHKNQRRRNRTPLHAPRSKGAPSARTKLPFAGLKVQILFSCSKPLSSFGGCALASDASAFPRGGRRCCVRPGEERLIYLCMCRTGSRSEMVASALSMLSLGEQAAPLGWHRGQRWHG